MKTNYLNIAAVCAAILLGSTFPGSCRKAPIPPRAEQIEQLVLEDKVEQAVDLILAEPDLTKPEVRPAVIALAETILRQSPLAYFDAERMSGESLKKFLDFPPELEALENSHESLDPNWQVLVRMSKAHLEDNPLDAKEREFYHLACLSRPPDLAAMREKMLDQTLGWYLRMRYIERLAVLGDSAAWAFIEDIWAERETLEDIAPAGPKKYTLYGAEIRFPRWAQERLLRIVARHWRCR